MSDQDRTAEAGLAQQFTYAHEALSQHFSGLSKDHIVTAARQFPGRMRADLQAAAETSFGTDALRLLGLYHDSPYGPLTIAALMKVSQHSIVIAPIAYEEVDVGDATPVHCLQNGLWLSRTGDLKYAVLLSHFTDHYGTSFVRVELVVPAGEAGAAITQRCFRDLELAVQAAKSYRGKVLSLELRHQYSGTSSGIAVHRLPEVRADEVILPEATLRLLQRNVIAFAARRGGLKALGMSTKKGILLYGPPGTGKTHTIRYLASSLAGHTTLLVTAEQVGLLPEYFSLARLLEPSILVIEDVDLIARDRESMNGACEEVMLNALLNEMDGLKEEAQIFFVLTTNRPQVLEAALASRPGRIDQAIEVPLPDDVGRAALMKLYARSLKLSADVVTSGVRRTQGVSAAFIKELMRRVAQANLERDGDGRVSEADIRQALEEMLITGGRLNAALLGGAGIVDTDGEAAPE
jgi:hypothetical protein